MNDGRGSQPVRVAGIVVAAGSGRRLGADLPKAFVEVAGETLLAHALRPLRAAGIRDVVAVVPEGWEERARTVADTGVAVVAGGSTRTRSVAAGLAVLGPDVAVVAVHDAARAFVPVEVVREVVAAVDGGTVAEVSGAGRAEAVLAAAPGLPVGDTLKRVAEDGSVVDTVGRTGLVGIQTPQVFRRAVLEQAHARAEATATSATDDLALVEDLVAAGQVSGRIVVTAGSPRAMKVTHPDDLAMAAALARRSEPEGP